MLSLKKYLNLDSQELPKVSEALLRLAHLLLQGIELHAIDVDPVEYDRFRCDVRVLAEKLGDAPDPSEALVVAGSVVKAMEDYKRHATRAIKQQGSEYNRIVEMLTQTLARFSAGSQESISRLQSFQKQLQQVAIVDDLRAVRSQLSQCLDELQEEKARQRGESAKVIAELRKNLQESVQRAPGAVTNADLDRCTGLPGRSSAEQFLVEAFDSEKPHYVALFVVDRVSAVNSRFGYSIGDEMLVCFAQHLTQKLSAADHCFRWNGPAFLAVLERSDRLPIVRSELQRVATKLEKTLKVGNRSVLIPVSVTWTVLVLSEQPGISKLTARLDAFITQQAQDADPQL